jgi:hypothetical protein
MNPGLHLWMLKPESSKRSIYIYIYTHSWNKPKMFKQTSAYQKADGGFHATRNHNNVRSVLLNTNIRLHRTIQNKRCWMLTYGVVFLYDNKHPHTAACSRPLLENSNWELVDYPLYSPDLALSDYHMGNLLNLRRSFFVYITYYTYFILFYYTTCFGYT